MRYHSICCTCMAGLGVLVDAIKVNPLPAPRDIQWNEHGNPIEISDNLQLDGTDNQYIQDGFRRMATSVRELKWEMTAVEGELDTVPIPIGEITGRQVAEPVSTVTVSIGDERAELQAGVDESYNLTVTNSGIELDANTIFGALHGFTTLQQIILYDGSSSSSSSRFIVEKPVSIVDGPLYEHRGLMIDTGRNYLSPGAIKRQLDGMALSKLNVLHWHLTDTQSWAVEVDPFPNMTKDAYSSRMIYSTAVISELIEYAHARGIRIIPEIDMPGHTNGGWEHTTPGVVTCENTFWGQLDPANNDTYDVVDKVYTDVSGKFKDHIFHVGHDEVSSYCWNMSSKVHQWLDEDPSRTYNTLFQHWINKTLEPIFMKIEGRRLMMWEDVLLGNLIYATIPVPKDVLIQSWNVGVPNIKNLTSMGYDVIVSTQDFFYLNCGVGSFYQMDPRLAAQLPEQDPTGFNYNTSGASPCGPYKNHERIYDYDFTAGLSDEEKAHVKGAEVTAFAELIDDSNIDNVVWPRAGAFGELVWSGNRSPDGVKRTYYLTQRIFNFRDYLVASGISATSLAPRFCQIHPHSCNLFQDPGAIP